MKKPTEFSNAALHNIQVILNDAISHRCDIVQSMNIVISVLARQIDDKERLEGFFNDVTEEFNTRMLSIIPPATDLIQ